jgi:hypothetical protein
MKESRLGAYPCLASTSCERQSVSFSIILSHPISSHIISYHLYHSVSFSILPLEHGRSPDGSASHTKSGRLGCHTLLNVLKKQHFVPSGAAGAGAGSGVGAAAGTVFGPVAFPTFAAGARARGGVTGCVPTPSPRAAPTHSPRPPPGRVVLKK